ncbi:hypothetical protein TRFO_42155 [Tritrichomonas foetus]|uniref:Uncharacterized protein n=1 Tax=Tritrichomonas foetus TaxID=1144522 RepID=A0A1J4KXK9_9EUKA|nr:hypothetical protein TRFO_42155 [Tritrichomonas foetus]|eukprot:OHT15985.1 hypothetical protein TRFO_42155 [Tritrichomonas foetus]
MFRYFCIGSILENQTMNVEDLRTTLIQFGQKNNIGVIGLAISVLTNGYGILKEGTEIPINIFNFLGNIDENEYRKQRILQMRQSSNVWISFEILLEGVYLNTDIFRDIFPDIVYIYLCITENKNTQLIMVTKNPRQILHIIRKISNSLNIYPEQIQVSPICESIEVAKNNLNNQIIDEKEEMDFTNQLLMTQYSTCNYMYTEKNERYDKECVCLSHNFPYGILDAVTGGFPLFLINTMNIDPREMIIMKNNYQKFCEVVFQNVQSYNHSLNISFKNKFPNVKWINDVKTSNDNVISKIHKWANKYSCGKYYTFDVRGKLAPFIFQPPPNYMMENAVLLIVSKDGWNDCITMTKRDETIIEVRMIDSFYDMVTNREGWTVNIDFVGIIRK